VLTKLAAEVVSQEMWLAVVFGGNMKYFHLPNWKWNFSSPLLRKIIFDVKYLENGERYNVGFKGIQIGNHQRAYNWHHDLGPWMILNWPSSRSLKLHV